MTGKIKIVKPNPATLKCCNSIIKKAIFQCFIFLTQSLETPGGPTLDMNSGVAQTRLWFVTTIPSSTLGWAARESQTGFGRNLSPCYEQNEDHPGLFHNKTNHIAILLLHPKLIIMIIRVIARLNSWSLPSPLAFMALAQLWVLLLQSLARLGHKGWLTEADSKEI